MCTAVSFLANDHYFGRNLDLEYHFEEQVVITPRGYSLAYRHTKTPNVHHAIIGMATVCMDYPLYYEATNEMGLSIAGLNFPGNAYYAEPEDGWINLASFELIPYLLQSCATVHEARAVLGHIRIVNTPFNDAFTPTPLHWIISDRKESVTVEPMKQGLNIWDNPVGVLTNNPPFDYHLHNLNNYMTLSREPVKNAFAPGLDLKPYSFGMSTIGLPGGLSSGSRFVKAAFTKWNSIWNDTEESQVSQFFHILQSVCQQKGLVRVKDQLFEFTLYSSCCNTDKGIYYYTTYNNGQITAVDMHREDLNGTRLITYPIRMKQQILWENVDRKHS